MMATPKRLRAAALVPWSAAGRVGILVHADRRQNAWILPGGGIEQYKNDRWELPIAAAIRELAEETGLRAVEVRALFVHQGTYREHHIVQIQASGELKIMSSREAPAFAVCGPELVPHMILCEPGYDTRGLVLSASTQAILMRYYQAQATGVPPLDHS